VSRFKGLVVDFGGVLTVALPGVMRDFCRSEGLPDDALHKLFERDPQGRASFAALERGAIGQGEWEWLAGTLLGVPADGLLRRMLSTLRPSVRMLEVVESVRRAGFATACLTNSFGLEPYNPYAPWQLEQRFDVVVISETEKLRKPEMEIYRRTLDRLSLPAECCLFLDDTEANLEPARELGMTAWHVTDPEATAAAVAVEFGVDGD
jgi:putative hydrolase of the HAD superfamily